MLRAHRNAQLTICAKLFGCNQPGSHRRGIVVVATVSISCAGPDSPLFKRRVLYLLCRRAGQR
eukprot:6183254-Pleurochrysis_carterae.AAC.1